MSQIKSKFIETLDGNKVILDNDQALKSANADGSGNVEILKVNALNDIELLKAFKLAAGQSITDAKHIVTKEYVDGAITDGVTDLVGAPNGLVPLNAQGKIDNQYYSSLVLVDVHVVADIAARDALTGIEEGDVAKVIDSGNGEPKTFISNGTEWVELEDGGQIASVNGQAGPHVVLDTGDVAESGDSRYYTAARQSAIQTQIDQEAIDRANADTALAQTIATETTNRQNDIEAVELAFAAADATLAGDISDEVTRATGAEEVLDAKIDQEIFDRSQAITAEASARSAADLTFLKTDGSRHMTGDLVFDSSFEPSTVSSWISFAQNVTTPDRSQLAKQPVSDAQSINFTGYSGQMLQQTFTADKSALLKKVEIIASIFQNFTTGLPVMEVRSVSGGVLGSVLATSGQMVDTGVSVTPQAISGINNPGNVKRYEFVLPSALQLTSGQVYACVIKMPSAQDNGVLNVYVKSAAYAGGQLTYYSNLDSFSGAFGANYNLDLATVIFEATGAGESYQIKGIADGTDANDAVTKSQLDAAIASSGGDISAETAARIAGDNALDARLDVLEGNSSVPGSVAKAEADAKSYADQKVSDLVASAPAVLDTLKELSDALGSDPNFATTVAGQIGAVDDKVDQEILDRQAAVAAEESARQSAVSALQSEIDAEELARQSAVSSLEAQIGAEEDAREAEDLTLLKLNGSRPMEGNLSMGSASSPLSVSATVGPDGEKLYNEQLSDPAFVFGMPVIVNGSSYDLADRADDGDGLYIRVYIPATTTFATFPLGFPVTVTASSGGSSASYKIVNLADGTDAADAVNKGQLDAAISSEQSSRESADLVLQGQIDAEELARAAAVSALELAIDEEETARAAADTSLDQRLDIVEALSVEKLEYQAFNLSSSDIANGYIDVSHSIIGVPMIQVGRVNLVPTEDFTVSGARITFAGSVASGGSEALEVGEKVQVYYMRTMQPFA